MTGPISLGTFEPVGSSRGLPGTPVRPTARKWWFEDPGPAFFNKWSITHVGWGIAWQLMFPDRYLAGLVVHTIYESIEGYIFPREDRDPSLRNHVGDTVCFGAGMLAASWATRRSALAGRSLRGVV